MKPSFRVLNALTACLAIPAAGQEQTLVGSGRASHGGYGAPVVKFTEVAGESAVLVGGRGGWIINHMFVLGGGGYGLSTHVDARTPGPFGERYLDFGYGGVILEYVIKSDRVVHGSLEVLVGGGAINHRRDWDDSDWRGAPRADAVTVLEPGGTVDVNITTWFRASAGLTYRIVTGARRVMATDGDLSAVSATLVFRFGKF